MEEVDFLFKAYYRPLCLYAIHYLQQPEAAEDVVQDCFVRLMERNSDTGQPRNTKAFLYTAVRNACLNILRGQNAIPTDIMPSDLEGVITDEEARERSVHEARLWTAIDTLPAREREVFLKSKRDGMTYRAIAAELGLSEKTVEHNISNALRHLRGKEKDILYLLCWVA